VYRNENFDAALTRETTVQALREANLTPGELDVIELHDAFAVEELLYTEAIGISPPR
jgi:acetyl-CoA acetyltransferase